MTLYFSEKLQALGIVHGTTDRTAANMRLAQNTRALFDGLHIPEEKILRFKQIHSDKIISVLSDGQARACAAAPFAEADGWILGASGWGAAIITADCVPLIVWDEDAQLIGLAHCGWRGVAAQLPAKLVQALKTAGARGTLSAWTGPHIQAQSFEVQTDVAAQFPTCTQNRNGKLFVDLNKAILQQLTAQGLQEKDIEFCPHCTCAEPENFFSFRREHTKDALLTFVYKAL
ncbi:MAG: laccase domain-containing protein [Elusimicrobiaceae bacterium]|nr:laccase domain-containing protein [Elusimicrobiaceae bacterium]